MTDFWDIEEGEIFDDASTIIPSLATAAIGEGYTVKPATIATVPANLILPVTATILLGDGCGVATRAASAANEVIGVMYYGVYKMQGCGGPITAGSFVMSSYATAEGSHLVCGTKDAVIGSGLGSLASLAVFGGASYILGMALQGCNASRDDLLILIGKAF